MHTEHELTLEPIASILRPAEAGEQNVRTYIAYFEDGEGEPYIVIKQRNWKGDSQVVCLGIDELKHVVDGAEKVINKLLEPKT